MTEGRSTSSSPEAAEAHAALREALRVHAPPLHDLVNRWPLLLDEICEIPLSEKLDCTHIRERLDRFTNNNPCALSYNAEKGAVLRLFRHACMVRLCLREVLGLADVATTSAELSDLVSVIADAALTHVLEKLCDEHGDVPRDTDGDAVPLTVLGMGKLGGRELNFGSDIDLCFFYESDEGQSGELRAHAFFTEAVLRFTKLLSEVTPEGFCFRVDLRLRPEGGQGPVVNSLQSAERYYETWGRTWERFALLRARPIAGDIAFGHRLLSALRPFVYRRAVEPTLAADAFAMVAQNRLEQHGEFQAAGPRFDLKIGRGGIREIEFFIQSLQLIWGGRHPSLRIQNSLEALASLHIEGLITDRERAHATDSWLFLRRLEHRIHMMLGYQSHAIPSDSERLSSMATGLGFASPTQLFETLEKHQSFVHTSFAALVPENAFEARSERLDLLCERVSPGVDSDELANLAQGILELRDGHEGAAHLQRLASHGDLPLGTRTRQRLPTLGPLLLQEVRESADPDAALKHLPDFFSRLGSPEAYGRFLAEAPERARKLIRLFGLSNTLSAQLIGHPEAVDIVLGSKEAPDATAIHVLVSDATSEAAACGDRFGLIAGLRSSKRDITLLVGLDFIAGRLTLESACARLSVLAEAQLNIAIRFAVLHHNGHGLLERTAVLALGKLGSRELGFASDLDLCFLVDTEGLDPEKRHLASQACQAALRLLSELHPEGQGYSTDLRLRPDGGQGPLLVSLSAFKNYYAERAAPWEKLALYRGRIAFGTELLRKRLASDLAEVLPIDPARDKTQVAALRARLQHEVARESPQRRHAKLGYGALFDIELLAQWLSYSAGLSPDFRPHPTAQQLAELAAVSALTEAEAEQLLDAWHFFRGIEQGLALIDETHSAYFRQSGPVADKVARFLGYYPRQERSAAEVVTSDWAEHAERTRSTLCRYLGPIAAKAPWRSEA